MIKTHSLTIGSTDADPMHTGGTMDTVAAKRQRIEQFIEAENTALRRTLRHYLSHSGLVEPAGLDEASQDLLNDVVVEALWMKGNGHI
jgi:hypothetical protein